MAPACSKATRASGSSNNSSLLLLLPHPIPPSPSHTPACYHNPYFFDEKEREKGESNLLIHWRSNQTCIRILATGDTKKTKTETITFRLPSALIEELRGDAEMEGMSLNSYASRIFSNHVQWERYERKVGLLPMTEAFLKEVLSQLSDEQVVNLAQKLEKQKFKNILAFMKDSPTVADFVELMRTWLNVSWMQQSVEVRDGDYRFKIQHGLGGKWSLYVKTLITELAQDVLGKKVEARTMGDTILFSFRE